MLIMRKIKFSVVIPTRNRPNTLASALRSCMEATFSDCEILICDNSDLGPRTAVRDLVDSIADRRVRLIENPETPCSMSRNWSFAVHEAVGEYVTVLGDDDGMLEFGLPVAEQVLRESEADVLLWPGSCYRWPDCAEVNRRITLFLSHGSHPGCTEWTKVCGKQFLQSVLNWPMSYHSFPMLYNAVVRKSIFAPLISRVNDFLLGQSPDIFSGVAACVLGKSFVRTDTSLTLQGLSGKSNGLAFMVLAGDPELKSDFVRLNPKDQRSEPQGVPNVSVCGAQVADSFNRLREQFPDVCRRFQMPIQRVAINQAIKIFERSPSNEVTSRQFQELCDFYSKTVLC
jgi:hypothetical protein